MVQIMELKHLPQECSRTKVSQCAAGPILELKSREAVFYRTWHREKIGKISREVSIKANEVVRVVLSS